MIEQTDRINMSINPTKRLNKLTDHAKNLLERSFSDWNKKDKLVSNLDKLNEKMLAAYNRCGGGPNGTDDDDDQPSKGNLSTVNDFQFKSKFLDFSL